MTVCISPSRNEELTAVFQQKQVLLKYVTAFFLSVLFFIVIFQLWKLEWLYIPFVYVSDAVYYSMNIKSVITTGWYLTNPLIGVPEGHFFYDFPMAEGLNYVIIKIIACFTSNWALVLNIFFLLGFPLTTISALFVSFRMGLSYPLALTCSLLFSFLPYHLLRGEEHVFLSAYYTVPLAIWLALLIYQNRILLEGKLNKKNGLLYFFICILIGSGGIYYAYFGCFFILLAGLISSYKIKHWHPIKYAVYLTTFITLSLIANIWPNIHYQIRHGSNLEVARRLPVESEMYGLKIAQLLLPANNDRIFAKLKKGYEKTSILINENTTASLGLIGSLGFLVLIGSIFFKREKQLDSSLIKALSDFNLSAVLLGTIGGFSSLIAFFITPSIRAYNRISIFIGFFALSAFFMFIQQKFRSPKLILKLSLMFLFIGLFNQSTKSESIRPRVKKISKLYKEDQAFFQQVEQIFSKGNMIFQLPYIPFPEGISIPMASHKPFNGEFHKTSYEHFKAALHTHSLKWSFGAIKGRQVAFWQAQTSQLPTSDMVKELVKNGFAGLYIDRRGYIDSGKQIESELSQILDITPIRDEYRSVWDLRTYHQIL